MSRRNEAVVLGALLVVLAGVVYFVYFRPSGPSASAPVVNETFMPLDVDNPALRMDVLRRFMSLEYKGTHRNIFSAKLPPPPTPPAPPITQPTGPVVPPPPPPLIVDAKFFGYVSDTGGNHRRAFFAANNNEDVFIASEGDTLMGRFRIVRISNTTADVEEVASGRRATLVLEEAGPNG